MPEEKNSSFLGDTLRFALITLAIVIPIRFFIAEPFIVSGASMEPTFHNGEYLIVDRLSYHVREPERGEVIVFRFPEDPSKHFIKRIIGLPEEKVRLVGKSVFITNEEHPQGEEIKEEYIRENGYNDLSITLGEDEYFVMGDNRNHSSDSRLWGALPQHFIVGRAYLRLFPIKTASYLPGDDSGRRQDR